MVPCEIIYLTEAHSSPGPAGFGYARNLVSDEFVTEGCERMLEQVYKDLEKLKAEGDVAAGYVYHFVEDYEVTTLVEHVRIKVCEAMDEDLDLVYVWIALSLRSLLRGWF
jgi:hypothetical protein